MSEKRTTLAGINKSLQDKNYQIERIDNKTFIAHDTNAGKSVKFNFTATLAVMEKEIETKGMKKFVKDNKSANLSLIKGKKFTKAITENEHDKDFDFDFTKLKASFENYYFPKEIGNITIRISMGRNTLLSGPSGCLSGETEIVIRVPKEIAEKLSQKNYGKAIIYKEKLLRQ